LTKRVLDRGRNAMAILQHSVSPSGMFGQFTGNLRAGTTDPQSPSL
jgi:hypothetical protein